MSHIFKRGVKEIRNSLVGKEWDDKNQTISDHSGGRVDDLNLNL